MNEEKNLNFDEVVERRNTDCLKYDFAQRRGRPADVLPLWVADMDFPTSSRIVDALVERAQHGIFGYTESRESYFEAVADWMKNRHGWTVKEPWLVKTPGVVFALAMAVKAYTQPGESVLIQQPVYYPFTEVIRDNGRRAVSSDLVYEPIRSPEEAANIRNAETQPGKYRIDFEDFEQKIVENEVKLFLLCSPHNPVSRVWTRAELLRIGEICLAHGVTVVSDEIHEDFTYGEHRHVVFANLKKEFADISITCTSPAKTFNLAGLQISNIFIPNGRLRAKFRHQIDAAGYSQLNAMGITACEAAYRCGTTWYEAMLDYVEKNIDYVRCFLKERLPEIHLIEPEGTYLLWLDFRDLHLTENELEVLVTRKARLWLDSGAIFGKTGEGFERINVACPRKTLVTAMERLERAIHSEWES